MPKIHITIVPKEVGQLWDDILDDVLNDVCNPVRQIPLNSLPDLIPHTYNPRYNLYQGQCYQQHTPNLCGYHATFNSLCFLNLIKRGQSHYNILSGSSFWRFKKEVESFLFRLKHKNHLAEEWPWRQKDILYGDFERTYNKLCLERFQDFQIFRKRQAFELFSFTWEFQYSNLLINEDKKKQLHKLIEYFRSYKGFRPLVISFMLGITNHWMCLNAVKVGQDTQYWFFDSFNRNVLDLSEKEMLQLAHQLNNQRIKFKKDPFSEFFLKHLPICFKDTQTSLRLIIDCLEGRTTIEKYTYNQLFNIFADQLQMHWNGDQKMFLSSIKDYWYNITSFLRNPVQIGLFTSQNATRFSKMVEKIQAIKGQTDQSKRLYQMVKKYENKACI